MSLFTKKAENPNEKAVESDGKIELRLSPDEINLLRLLKQDWNAEQNEHAIAVLKVKLNMIDNLQEKTIFKGQSDYYKNLQ